MIRVSKATWVPVETKVSWVTMMTWVTWVTRVTWGDQGGFDNFVS